MAALLNRARMSTATTGTGTITLGSAVTGYLSFAEAGAVNATVYSYTIQEGNDFEIGVGTYTTSGTTFSRDTVAASKISGTAGTTKMTLAGAAQIFISPRKEDLSGGVLTTTGDILFRDAAGLQRLAKGTALQMLRQNSALTAPEWANTLEILTGTRTYYVRTDGSDSNTGTADTSGGAFLTPQKALDTLNMLHQNGFTVTISIRGSFNTGITVTTSPSGPVVITGTTGTPATDILGNTAVYGLRVQVPANISIGNFTIKGSYQALAIENGGARVEILAGMVFSGASSSAHIALTAGSLACQASHSHTGNAGAWLVCLGPGALAEIGNCTITFTGTPAWGSAGIVFTNGGVVSLFSVTMSGSATGARYSGVTYGVLQSFGAGSASTYFPGSTNGTLSNALQS